MSRHARSAAAPPRRTLRTASTAACVAVALACAGPVRAQAPAAASGARIYTPADLARSNPRTAIDMLRQVPGFVIMGATTERGLGQASGNVLINGQRVSAKSNSAVAELGRIPIQNVVKIEIVDGATLNIPGLAGEVANVVVNADGVSGQFKWEPDVRAYYTTPNLGRFESSVSGTWGPVEYTLALQNNAGRGAAGGLTRIYGADGVLTEVRDEVWRHEHERPKVSGRFVYDGPGSSIGNLALSYEKFIAGYAEKGVRTGPGLVKRWRRLGNDEDTSNWEVGGDYEFALGPGRLKLIGLNRAQDEPYFSDLVTVFADHTPSSGESTKRARRALERVARAEYRWSNGAGDWQLSAERAFNSLDQATRLFNLDPAGDLLETAFPDGAARVQENRSEVMGSYSRTLSPSFSFQLSAGGEYSKLAQVGAGGRVRTFWRPKGLASAAWKAAPGLDVNLRLERKVGQLGFFNFLATVNLGNDIRNAGNPELVPPQSWDGEVEAIRSLGAYGVARVRLYGRLIEDIVDTVPIGLTGESPGNLDHATVFGVAWNSTLELGPLGFTGAKLDARLQLERSRVADPLTGRPRPISNNLIRNMFLEFRHDVPRTDWAWGAEASQWFNARNYRLTEVGREWEGPFWASVYAENKDVFGLTVRATVANALGARALWNRTVYTGRRTGPVSFIERRDRNIGPIFALEVSGRF